MPRQRRYEPGRASASAAKWTELDGTLFKRAAVPVEVLDPTNISTSTKGNRLLKHREKFYTYRILLYAEA